MTKRRIYGLLPSGDLETLRARLHDFVDWKGVPGERVYVSPRVLFPFLGPPRVKPVRIPPPAEIERVTGREDLRKLAKALHVTPSGSNAEVRARVHAAVVERTRRGLARAPHPDPRAFGPAVSRIPVEDLENVDALRGELLRVMKGMGDVETQLNARVRDLEASLESVSRERSALKARHEAIEAKSGEVARREKDASALAAGLVTREAELTKLGDEVKASAVLLTRETERVSREFEEARLASAAAREATLSKMVADLQARQAKAEEASDRMRALESRLMRSEGKLAEAEQILASREDLERRERAISLREEEIDAAASATLEPAGQAEIEQRIWSVRAREELVRQREIELVAAREEIAIAKERAA